MIRRILIDHARARQTAKRGGDRLKLTLDEAADVFSYQELDILEIDLALEKLAALDERQALIVEMRFFGGSSMAEVAESLGVSKSTVENDWVLAKAWLHKEMGME